MIAPLLLLSAAAFASEPALTFKRDGQDVASLTVAELSAKVAPQTVTVADPFHDGKRKTYRCFPIARLMAAVYGEGWHDEEHTEASLVALDGYASQASSAKLAEKGGCLAFEDVDRAPSWEPIGYKKADPAPFYLFWSEPGQTTENAYPWPWQLAAIDLINFEKAYPEVVPRGAPKTSAAQRGYTLFRARCMRCHAINQEGGKIGPDLNAPMSVVQYRTKKWLKSWIRQPSKYRYTQMPDHLDLKDSDLDDLYDYFKLKSTQPEKKAF